MIVMILVLGKALLSLLFYTNNPFSKFLSPLFPYFFVEGHLKACNLLPLLCSLSLISPTFDVKSIIFPNFGQGPFPKIAEKIPETMGTTINNEPTTEPLP